jgi:hypothetical protein
VIANALIRKAVEVEYTLVRTPLAAAERRLPAGSSIRTLLDRSLHTLDELIAGLLAEPYDIAVRTAEDSHDEHAVQLQHDREEIAEAVRQQQPSVGELADPDLDVAEVQAQLRAKHAVEEREEARLFKERGGR